jgi:hypothetical protein
MGLIIFTTEGTEGCTEAHREVEKKRPAERISNECGLVLVAF